MFVQMVPSEAGGRRGKNISNLEHFSKYNVPLFSIRYIFKYYSWQHSLKEFSQNMFQSSMAKIVIPKRSAIILAGDVGMFKTIKSKFQLLIGQPYYRILRIVWLSALLISSKMTTDLSLGSRVPNDTTGKLFMASSLRGHPYMTSSLRGEGG